jgi:hypothetical protein
MVRNQALEKFADRVEGRRFSFGVSVLCWSSLREGSLRGCRLRWRGSCWRFRCGWLCGRALLNDARLRGYRCGLSWRGDGFRWSRRGGVLRFRCFAWFVLAAATCRAGGAAYAVARSSNPEQVAARQGHG